MREKPAIGEESLRACLQDQYGLHSVLLEFLPLGLDYDAGVYRVVDARDRAYLLKVTTRVLYEPSCLVPAYLRAQGITSVVAPVPTTSGVLWAKLGNWTVLLYPWIDGDSSWTGMTNAQWKEVGSIFRHIHHAALPPGGFEALRKERFDPSGYVQWVHTFEADEVQHEQELNQASAARRALRASWQAHRSTIHMGLTTLETLAQALRSQTLPFVICHADLHASNLIRDSAGHVFVIDWDEVMLAPKERDFIFIREPHAQAFFQGYGASEIDWNLLAYYLWERVVQDIIYDAQHVCLRDDWAEETRAHVAQIFHEYLEGDRNLRAALEVSARLASLPSQF